MDLFVKVCIFHTRKNKWNNPNYKEINKTNPKKSKQVKFSEKNKTKMSENRPTFACIKQNRKKNH